jgi:hypothetical protein
MFANVAAHQPLRSHYQATNGHLLAVEQSSQ